MNYNAWEHEIDIVLAYYPIELSPLYTLFSTKEKIS